MRRVNKIAARPSSVTKTGQNEVITSISVLVNEYGLETKTDRTSKLLWNWRIIYTASTKGKLFLIEEFIKKSCYNFLLMFLPYI